MDAASEPFQFVFYPEFFFFERRDPDFVPIGVGHFGGDGFFELFMLFGQFLDMPLLKRHAEPLHIGVTIRAPSVPSVTPLFPASLRESKGNHAA